LTEGAHDLIIILMKNLQKPKVTLLPIFLENSEPKTGQEHKF